MGGHGNGLFALRFLCVCAGEGHGRRGDEAACAAKLERIRTQYAYSSGTMGLVFDLFFFFAFHGEQAIVLIFHTRTAELALFMPSCPLRTLAASRYFCSDRSLSVFALC